MAIFLLFQKFSFAQLTDPIYSSRLLFIAGGGKMHYLISYVPFIVAPRTASIWTGIDSRTFHETIDSLILYVCSAISGFRSNKVNGMA